MMTISNRICIKCGTKNHIELFDFRKDTRRYINICKECRNERMRDRRNLDKEKINAKNKKYRADNPEKYRKYCNNSYHKNKHKYKDRTSKWRENNKEYTKKYNIRYKLENADKIIAYENGAERKRQKRIYMKKYEEKRLRNDLLYRLSKNLRARLRAAIHNNYKTGSAVGDLGCSICEFKKYIESKFQNGMTWDNYGKWHIDHIRPLASYDLTDAKQIKEACHYTNLQPLWAKDNLAKRDKYESPTKDFINN